jgi:hypothetical protein
MQPSGLLVMIVSVGTVTTLFAWCLWRVLMPAEIGPAEVRRDRRPSASE